MEPHELNRMFDRLAPSPEQERAVLDRLLQTERKDFPVKKLKKLTVLSIAAALMIISCAAAVVTGLDQRLADYFGANPEQAELLAPGALPVDVTVEDNGAPFHVSQVLMDRYFILLLADFTAPEGTVLDRDDYVFDVLDAPVGVMPDLLDRAGEPIEIEGGWGWQLQVLDDSDPMDNHLTLLFRLELDDGVQPDWEIGGIFLPFRDLIRYGEEPWDKLTVYSGDWSCEVPFTWQDMGRSIYPNQVIGQLDSKDITLTEVYLSPMTMKIYYEWDIPALKNTKTYPMNVRWHQVLDSDRMTLTTGDGQVVDLIEMGGTSGYRDQDRSYQLGEITALAALEGGNLNIRIEGGSVDIPLDGLAPAE